MHISRSNDLHYVLIKEAHHPHQFHLSASYICFFYFTSSVWGSFLSLVLLWGNVSRMCVSIRIHTVFKIFVSADLSVPPTVVVLFLFFIRFVFSFLFHKSCVLVSTTRTTEHTILSDHIYIRASQPNSQLSSITIFDVCVCMWVYACAWCELGREKGRERDMRERESESGSTRFCYYYCWCYYLYRYKQQETWKRGKIPLLVLLQAMTTPLLIALFHLVVIACYLLFLSLHHHTICSIVRKVEKWEEIHDHLSPCF